ncbi:MAG: hypothetical protein QG637_227, partial [Chloroflexota bacterium]|nr:hypothetical protein [Chloroflexota bacterium]
MTVQTITLRLPENLYLRFPLCHDLAWPRV